MLAIRFVLIRPFCFVKLILVCLGCSPTSSKLQNGLASICNPPPILSHNRQSARRLSLGRALILPLPGLFTPLLKGAQFLYGFYDKRSLHHDSKIWILQTTADVNSTCCFIDRYKQLFHLFLYLSDSLFTLICSL